MGGAGAPPIFHILVQNCMLTKLVFRRILVLLAFITLLAACDGPSLPVPLPPTKNPNLQTVGQNHQHGEGGSGGGRLITVYGGPLKSSVVTEPAAPTAGQPLTITYDLKDGDGKGATPDALQVTHERLMHL